MKWSELESDVCPIARSLSLIGDRWTMLIIRDCFLGKTRFGQFQSSLGITRHILTDRLKRLVEAGLLIKLEYARGRYDYRLSETGKDLEPVLRELFKWGKRHRPVRRKTS
ncbi:MAG: helix-turn-helix domain-containing protein [Pseudomonadota bacterium]